MRMQRLLALLALFAVPTSSLKLPALSSRRSNARATAVPTAALPASRPHEGRANHVSRTASGPELCAAASAGPDENSATAALRAVLGFLDRRYFLVGLFAAVGLAALFPSAGLLLRPEISVAWGATCGIFLLSGLSLSTTELATAAQRYREHALIQSFNLVGIPLLMLAALSPLVACGLLAPALRDGMLVMCAVPTTINMSVSLSRAAGADEALAIFNAVLGNFLGVVVTPFSLLLLLGSTGTVSALDTLRKLSAKVLLPIFAGQLLRRTPLAAPLTRRKKLLSRTSESLLLLIIFSTFCDTFMRGFALPPSTLATLALLVSTSHFVFLGLAWRLGAAARLAPRQRAALLLSSTQKTLALGLPLLRVVFSGRPDLALLCTPLLIQHPLQLVVGSLLVPRLKSYVEEGDAGARGD